MTELFTNISDEVKQVAEFTWQMAMAKNSLMETAELLDTVTNYYRIFGTPDEVEFLRFYFNMKMEMMKQ